MEENIYIGMHKICEAARVELESLEKGTRISCDDLDSKVKARVEASDTAIKSIVKIYVLGAKDKYTLENDKTILIGKRGPGRPRLQTTVSEESKET